MTEFKPDIYDDYCVTLYRSTLSRTVMLVVIDGFRGSGFSVMGDTAALPELMEQLAQRLRLQFPAADADIITTLSSAITRSTTVLSTDLRVPVASSPGDRLGASCIPVLGRPAWLSRAFDQATTLDRGRERLSAPSAGALQRARYQAWTYRYRDSNESGFALQAV
jgi:hypothetical protein